MTRAFIFPGQGSQYTGMGKALADAFEPARLVFEEVNDALGQNLSAIMWEEGQEDALRMTENTQPALMAHSLAIVKILEANGQSIADLASHVAGHSLGEYSALCAAGTFSLSDTAKLLKLRGQAMQRAVPVGEGAMAAILGLEMDAVKQACTAGEEEGVVVPANDNGGGQVVISGSKPAVEKAAEVAKELGARRAVMLPVSAPFHCPLMKPAADEMEEALSSVTLTSPSVPVIANVIAAPTSDVDQIRGLLVEQVCGSVRWRESVGSMADLGIDTLVEVGAGKVLSGMTRRIDKSLSGHNIQDPEQLDAFLNTL
ncbi:ACP S-malonyltransferase [Temperatibacter marinus]|uniref:Malonyl CoA-acyl carrier protein transacylase n=1 Tax=Temperatibacter marinus TaxID=1456591 RepID=A0AA52EH01_9PROT|nr:ACP S-malonyltransferase [Temperatibacter marinus]WND02352.1 ACP S-malonyltransferase [Temperatibacter marinus]